MTNFLIIALCILAGIYYRKYGNLPKDAYKGINTWIINIALPAMSFKYLPHIKLTPELLFPAAVPFIVWIFGWLYIQCYAKLKNLNKATSGGLKLTSAFSNTSFVGFPLIMAYFSEKEIGIAIITDQVGFMLFSTVGIIVAIRSSQNQQLDAKAVLKKVATFPPIWGCILALTLPRYVDISPMYSLFDKLTATLGPLALFSIGLQLRFGGWYQELKHIRIALFYKLILAPAIVSAFAMLLGLKGIVPKIAIFETAMPTLLTSGIVAGQYNLNPKLSTLVVGVGIALSFLTTCAWYFVLQKSGLF
jgi:predicted permease